VFFGPWLSLSMATFQDAVPPAALSQLLAARSSLLIMRHPNSRLGPPDTHRAHEMQTFAQAPKRIPRI
jgi:hypothetical protein